MALATIDDFNVRIGRTLTGDDEARAEALLDDSTAAVSAYIGQTVEETTYTEKRIQARNGQIRLPQRPVTAVTAVTNVDGDALVFTWDHGQVVYLNGLGFGLNSFEVNPIRNRRLFVDVTYTAGYDTIPADIVAVTVQAAIRAYGVNPENSGLQSEQIAGYSYTIGSVGASGAVGLLNEEKAVLDRYRVVGGTAYLAYR